MKKAKILAILMTLIICGFCFCACSNNSNQNEQNQQSSKTQTAKTEDDKEVYQNLLAANEKYNVSKEDICKQNFDCKPEEIMENVIISPSYSPEIFETYAKNFTLVARGRFPVINIETDSKTVSYIITGLYSPNVLDAVLTLGCTPCKQVLFIDDIGGLVENLNVGDIVIPEYAIAGTGADRYLTTAKKLSENDCFGEKDYPNSDLVNKLTTKIDDALKNSSIKSHKGQTFCSDCFFCERAHIDEMLSLGANTIGTETSAFFHGAKVAGLNAAALLTVSNNMVSDNTLYNAETSIQALENTKSTIVSKVALSLFND